mmetsp:Transcript_40844/g.104516  ORF Transcript_40844/g.104516 Transcript_40844/m.104516 type:complete len:345 (+) Transcript_40844:287-1321(+)
MGDAPRLAAVLQPHSGQPAPVVADDMDGTAKPMKQSNNKATSESPLGIVGFYLVVGAALASALARHLMCLVFGRQSGDNAISSGGPSADGHPVAEASETTPGAKLDGSFKTRQIHLDASPPLVDVSNKTPDSASGRARVVLSPGTPGLKSERQRQDGYGKGRSALPSTAEDSAHGSDATGGEDTTCSDDAATAEDVVVKVQLESRYDSADSAMLEKAAQPVAADLVQIHLILAPNGQVGVVEPAAIPASPTAHQLAADDFDSNSSPFSDEQTTGGATAPGRPKDGSATATGSPSPRVSCPTCLPRMPGKARRSSEPGEPQSTHHQSLAKGLKMKFKRARNKSTS